MAREGRFRESSVRGHGLLAAPAPYAITLAHRRPQRLVQIGDDVVHVLDADGQPNQVRAHAGRPLFLVGQLLVGRARRMNDQRFGVTDVGQKREQLHVVDEASARFQPALDAEGEDASPAPLGKYFCASS